MTRIRHILILLLCLAASCADDYESRSDSTLPTGKDESILTLCLPPTRSVPTTESIGSSDAEEAERRISSLWFFAFPCGDAGAQWQGEALAKDLTTDYLTHDYKDNTFSFKIKLGTYRIYVVANVPEITSTYTEEQLKAVILKYKEGDDIKLPSTDKAGTGLPMAYEAPDPITIHYGDEPIIQADLTFTCVKVRYTLLFDNTANSGVSNGTFGENRVKIADVTVRNIAQEATLLKENPTQEKAVIENGIYTIPGNLYDNHSDVPDSYARWEYSGTVYLPEHYVTKDTQKNQTELCIRAWLLDKNDAEISPLKYTIELGDTQTDSEENGVRNLSRGTYYDITGRIVGLGEELELTVTPEEWTLETLRTDLYGYYYLWVDKTESPINSGETVTVSYETDAPVLTFESEKVTVNTADGGETEMDLFIIRKNDDGKTFGIELNPQVGLISDEKTEGYIYVVAGQLKKKIVLNPITTEYYLVATPASQTVYIKDIPNHLTEFPVVYTYRTNYPYVKVAPVNSQPGKLVEEDSGLDKTTGSGTLTCTLVNPHRVGHFDKTLTEIYYYYGYKTQADYEADNPAETVSTVLTIIPNAQKYTLHFRPIDDSWTEPHIYVYEPLYTPNGTEIQISSTPAGENAILYGFTGKRTFKGWTTEGGTVTNPVPSGNDREGMIYTTGRNYDPLYTDIYTDQIDYCPEFRIDCCADAYNPKWPGVKMKKDADNPGWWYFDLPALAQPGIALIMFTEGHSSDKGDEKPVKQRYPAHMVPGVPLYNFADKDGWFLYDWDKNTNEFEDDKPNVPDLGGEELNGKRLRIWNRNYPGRQKVYVWYKPTPSSPATKLAGEWPGTMLSTGSEGLYIDVVASWSSYPSEFGVIFLNTDSDKTGNLIVKLAKWHKTEGKDYDYEVEL